MAPLLLLMAMASNFQTKILNMPLILALYEIWTMPQTKILNTPVIFNTYQRIL